MLNFIASIITFFFTAQAFVSPVPDVDRPMIEISKPAAPVILAERSLSLGNRAANPRINEVFRKNILLNLAYLDGSVIHKEDINWTKLENPYTFSVTIEPEQLFAYHDDLLPEYEGMKVITTNSYFNAQQGYVNSGFLYGDGVCHLASIVNWVAQDAGLEVRVTKLHSIAPIPDIPDEYGVSIYTIAGKKGSGARNNLYITNNKTKPVTFEFEFDSQNQLTVRVTS